MRSQKPPAGDDAIIGRTIGHYRVCEFIAKGGMGTVYRAEHHLIGKHAAVKVLRPELTRHADVVQRFFNEAKAASAIRHPGIVEVYDFGHLPDGRAYIVMELLDGETLAERLERCERLSELSAAVIGRGIAVALAAAHAMGIVHRDLKPENIVLVPDPELPTGERCKVLDFGIAKLGNHIGDNAKTLTGTFMGTPLYVAPEQARGAVDLDHRADLYSLGCLLYEMVTGEPPFLAEGAAEILAMHLYGEVVPPSERVEISPAFEDVIMRLLAKRPEDRYESANEVVAAIAMALPHLSERLSSVIAVPGGGVTLHAPMLVPNPRQRLTPRPPGTPTTLGASSGQSDVVTRRSRVPLVVFGCALMVAAVVVGLGTRSTWFGLVPELMAPTPAVADSASPTPEQASPAIATMALPAIAERDRGQASGQASGQAPGQASGAPAPDVAVPTEVVLTVTTEPADAVIFVDDRRVAEAGGRIRLLRGSTQHRVEVTAPGHVTGRLVVDADRDQTISVALAPQTQPVPVRVAPPRVAPPRTRAVSRTGADSDDDDEPAPRRSIVLPRAEPEDTRTPGGSPIEETL